MILLHFAYFTLVYYYIFVLFFYSLFLQNYFSDILHEYFPNFWNTSHYEKRSRWIHTTRFVVFFRASGRCTNNKYWRRFVGAKSSNSLQSRLCDKWLMWKLARRLFRWPPCTCNLCKKIYVLFNFTLRRSQNIQNIFVVIYL